MMGLVVMPTRRLSWLWMQMRRRTAPKRKTSPKELAMLFDILEDHFSGTSETKKK
jgi:hypothetical protein